MSVLANGTASLLSKVIIYNNSTWKPSRFWVKMLQDLNLGLDVEDYYKIKDNNNMSESNEFR